MFWFRVARSVPELSTEMRAKQIAVDLILFSATPLFVAGAALAVMYQSSFLTAVSASMEPSISPGDTLITRKIDSNLIKKDDVVVLPVPTNKSISYSHRVLTVIREPNGVVLQTKGDANPNPDKWLIKVTSEKTPQVIAVIPTAGIFNDWVDRRFLYIFLMAAGALLSFVGAIRLIRGGRSST
jgi:signal peptidase